MQKADVTSPPNDAYVSAIQAASIADTTKAQYITIIKRILKACSGMSLHQAINSPDTAFPLLQQAIPNERTLVTTVSTVLALFKYSKQKSSKNPHYKKWYTIRDKFKKKQESDAKLSVPTGRAAEGYVDWADVIAARDKLAKEAYGSKEHLCFAMYTYIPPRRQEDYYRTFIVNDAKVHNLDGCSAFINLHGNTPVLKVLKYKTVKTYNAWSKELSQECQPLLDIIKYSLARDPRQFLFVQANGQPFTNVIAFTQFTNRILKKHLGSKVTLNSLRHAASKANLTNAYRSFQQQEQFAQDMGHSMATHQLYRFVPPT